MPRGEPSTTVNGSFERFINSMSDDEYSLWLEEDATDSQESVALDFREPIRDQELSQLEDEQSFAGDVGEVAEDVAEEAVSRVGSAVSRAIQFLRGVFRV